MSLLYAFNDMDLWTIILTIAGGALCVYLFSAWRYSYGYFKKRGIPFVKPTPIFGNNAAMMLKMKNMIEVIEETYSCDPDAKYVGFYDFSTPVIVLKDPELVKSVTIKNFDSFPNHRLVFDASSEPLFEKNLFALQDDEWKNMRTVLSPAFTSSKMKMMFEIMSECAEGFSDCLANRNSQPEELNMKETFGRYTLDVIASAAFGLSVNSMKDRDNDFYLMGKEAADFTGLKMIKFFLIRSFPRLVKLFKVKLLNPKTVDYFMEVIKTTIATRDAQGIVRPDMIHLMMQARDDKEKSPPSHQDIAAQAFIFFIAGFDTPSTAMTFAALLLALNPEVQRKLQAEIDEVIEKSSGKVSYEDLHAMKYLDGVVSETLRLFPPAPVMDRTAAKSFTLPPALPGLEPVEIEAGQNVWIPSYSIHHDPRFFPDPEKFDPERFSDENKSDILPFTYFPFGIGPRMCIANRFALMEVKLALFHVLAKCSFLPTPKTPPVIKLSSSAIVMIPRGGFNLKVQPRS